MLLRWRWILACKLCPELVDHYDKVLEVAGEEIRGYQAFVDGVYRLQQQYPVGDLSLELNPLFTELYDSEAEYSPE